LQKKELSKFFAHNNVKSIKGMIIWKEWLKK